jgi:vacuolar protein sorting-associated protein 52
MFLDRFSGHPTPSASPVPSQRSYSPAPRRPNNLPPNLSRPSLNPRSSSLGSLVSGRANSSSNSLPGTNRLPNGSSLKQSSIPPPDVEDPVVLLEKIVGSTLRREDDTENQIVVERPDELVEDVDFRSLSLKDFLHEAGEESDTQDEMITESVQSVEECEYVGLGLVFRIDY